eukprot:CAMPEP_0118952946 /NCGR_PEP_ID=MMETSP1169-20130426/55708_1 /TAXON_ID=36882 /ORGANISM="Pyramimonas obovata, Strain CCMP722" /LENGTH=57 /DNA_ID=CAMNT_0006900293 /DNA_START=37 /DNA_END=207 /DNA_ORIENTATION=-
MSAPEFLAQKDLAMDQVLDDWRCDPATNMSPVDPTLPCDPQCDLSTYFTFDYDAKTA